MSALLALRLEAASREILDAPVESVTITNRLNICLSSDCITTMSITILDSTSFSERYGDRWSRFWHSATSSWLRSSDRCAWSITHETRSGTRSLSFGVSLCQAHCEGGCQVKAISPLSMGMRILHNASIILCHHLLCQQYLRITRSNSL